ncbi:MAG: hypothetical protein WBG11_13125 [Methylocella sp.]
MTISNNPAASGSAFTLDMGKDSITGNQVQKVALTEPSGGTFITPMQQAGGSVTSLSSGAITNPASVLTRPSNTTAYATNQLIASSTAAGSIAVPAFLIPVAAGGVILSRLRLRTNAASGWNGINLSVNLWSAPPAYANGDGGAYAVATGSANWLANFLISLLQFGDGAAGAGPLTGGNEMTLKLASGTSVFWDIQMLSAAATPIAGQTFTLTGELLN